MLLRSSHLLARVTATVALPALLGACDSGNSQAVEKPEVFTGTCPEGTVMSSSRCVDAVYTVERTVAFNSVGYHPDRTKLATLLLDVDEVRILDDAGEVVFRTTPSEPVHDESLEQDVWVVDFSELTEPGTYTLEYDDLDPTYATALHFEISEDVFDDALRTAMLGITGQRCGTAVSLEHEDTTFSHRECHLGDGLMSKAGEGASEESRDGTGGWHDAGDYGKYVVNGAFAAGFMLAAWELLPGRLDRESLHFQVPEEGNLPAYLAEVKWELDWLFKMQRDDGAVYHKLTRLGFEGDVMPSNDSGHRYFSPIGSAATADFVAAMAQASRIYAEYDPDFANDCLEAAEQSYAFLVANPEPIRPDLSEFGTGAYQTDDSDDRAWAAAELWAATGNLDALADFEARVSADLLRVNFGWADLGNLGVFTYLMSTREGRSDETVATLTDRLLALADSMVTNARENPWGIGYRGGPYWGINGAVVGSAANALVAYQLDPKPEYLDVAIQQVDYAFGRNPVARSYVTGVGIAPPQNPHHRPSSTDDVPTRPWPGFLVGGPNREENGADWADYKDEAASYWTNEVALNWSAALIFALAADYSG